MGRFYSDELEEGVRLIYFQSDRTKYPEGVRLIEEAMEKGEPDAYYFGARLYAWGDGEVKENQAKAVAFSLKGIELGSALCVLGADRMQELKGSLAAAMTKTLREYLNDVMAMANNGNSMAAYAVALFYYWGDIYALLPEPKSKDEAEQNIRNCGRESQKWYKLAAKGGCIPAFRNMYVATVDGKNDVVKDYDAAMAFVEEYKAYVDVPGALCYNIACDYENHKNIDKAIQWTNRGISKGDSACMIELGLAYLDGNSMVTQDTNRAIEYFKKAIDTDGNRYAYWNMGRIYFYGKGIREDKEHAFEYFKEAAQRGHSTAQKMLAKYFYEGIGGVGINYEKCRYWAEKSAGNKCEAAKLYLGLCYLNGYGVVQNTQLAMRYLKEAAAAAKDGEALFYLGDMYDRGIGVPENIEQAAYYYGQSKVQGYAPAETRLKGFKETFFGKWKRV